MSSSPSSFLSSNLTKRVLSAFILIPVVLGAVWLGDWAYFALIALVSGLGMAEWLGLTAQKMAIRGKSAAFAGLLVPLVTQMTRGWLAALILLGLGMVLTFYYARCAGKDGKLADGLSPRWVAAGLPYLALGAGGMLALRAVPDKGLFLTCFLLFSVWATDTGAYAAGRTIGGPKLLPRISPKKTWAGLIGGMVLAALIGYGCALGFGESAPASYAALAAVLALVSQAGDFFESYVKRRAGAKDSGTLIPGHGGVLDRIDGLLFAAAFMALVV